ncbi:MAG: ParB/RepB/Spo0J family partition protein [Ruminococcaceae bacterium]|nr:ParB/RepB/Spo0J family partition protein [Oscillospiraceae bacterium]
MKRVLGQGLDALFARTDINEEKTSTDEKGEVRIIKTSLIEPRKDQPRKNFDREQLQALANSISEHGIIQPIIVVEGENGYYSIIAGERRWRAAKLAGLTQIPAIVRTYDEMQIAEVALIENLQREDLNPIEEALGYKTLMERFSMTQDKVSERVGKSRSNVANMLRLLSLEDEIKDMLSQNRLSMGHARALLSLPAGSKRVQAAEKIVSEGLNVRQVEALGKELSVPEKKTRTPKESVYPDVERTLSEKYGTKVRIKGNRKGKIEIEFYSVADLTRIVDILN